jgi:hypothetical protein
MASTSPNRPGWLPPPAPGERASEVGPDLRAGRSNDADSQGISYLGGQLGDLPLPVTCTDPKLLVQVTKPARLCERRLALTNYAKDTEPPDSILGHLSFQRAFQRCRAF